MGECGNTAIVLAAGQGKRMHSKIQKQFMELGGKPVLCYSLRCFQESPLIRDIILVTGEEYISYCREEIVEKYGFTKVSAVVCGGKERYDSVYEGLRACKDTEYVLIHDGARPFIDDGIIERGLAAASKTGASVVGMPSKDTVKIADAEGNVTVVHCTYDPETKCGTGFTRRKVKGTIHWVSAPQAKKAEIRLYENLIDEEKGVYNKEDGSLNLNPNSLQILKECYVEDSFAEAGPCDSFQFVRNGYFCIDSKDSTPENLVFNRIVSLKSSFKLPKK